MAGKLAVLDDVCRRPHRSCIIMRWFEHAIVRSDDEGEGQARHGTPAMPPGLDEYGQTSLRSRVYFSPQAGQVLVEPERSAYGACTG